MSESIASPGLEHTACAVCGKDDAGLWLAVRDIEFGGSEPFRIVRCRNCGLRYLDPRPTPRAISQYYPANYYTHAAIPDQRLVRTYAETMSLVTRYGRLGSLLDVGSGDGAFLSLLKRGGWQDVEGIEPDSSAREVAVSRGLRVAQGQFPDQRSDRTGFATMTMLETIEHLHDPRAALVAAYELLAPGGRLIVTTPNVEGIEFRVLRHHSVSLQVPRHLYFFTPASLTALVGELGFEVVALRTGGTFAGVLRSLWLTVRGAPDGPSGTGDPTFKPTSWRRRIHEVLDSVTSPPARLAAKCGWGPTLLLVVQRPEAA